MDFFICENVFVPLRSGPSHKTEMLSQVLFGEKYQIIDKLGHWLKIRTLFDNYSGWIDMNHVQQCQTSDKEHGMVLNRSLLCYKSDKTKIILEAGCEIYEPDFEGKKFSIGDNLYQTCPDFNKSYVVTKGTLEDTAMRFLNSPYIWGGRIAPGIDCSGFTQLIYKIHGIPIPRDSWKQAESGVMVNFLDETKPGDLVFFDNEQEKITHVGMIISRGLVIHASGRVRMDAIDHQGIYKKEERRYSHHLRMIKRLV